MYFEGILTPVVVPFNDNFTLNRKALEQIINLLAKSGVHGIIVADTMGEYYAMSMKERVYLIGLIKEMLGGRLPMIVGTGAIRTEESIEYALQAKSHGADAIVISTPPYACPTGHEIALHVLEIDQAVNLPIILHNDPSRMSKNMNKETLVQLSHLPNCTIQESSGDLSRLHMLARDFPNIALSCGSNDQALEFFAWGARSWVCAASNFAPEAHIAIYKACVIEGDFNKGREIMTAMLPLIQALEKNGTIIQSVKYCLKMRGIDAGPPRKPLRPLEKNDKRILEELVHALINEISIIEKGNS